MRHIIPVSGKDSLATAIVQMSNEPHLDYELMYNFTGAETPEVDEWLNKVEDYFGKSITRVGSSLEDIIYEQGILPSVQVRYCTKMAKIHPMLDYIGKEQATVYYGIRADEMRSGYSSLRGMGKNIIPRYPLKDSGIGLSDVWTILVDRDLLPPTFFWQSMFDMVEKKLGDNKYLIDQLNKQVFYSLFAGRSRANCYFCFFQRRYEFVWLEETHPDLFVKAVEIEETTGAQGYTWIKDMSLRQIYDRRYKIKENRARDIYQFIIGSQQISMFDVMEPRDLLSIASCGLFCGK